VPFLSEFAGALTLPDSNTISDDNTINVEFSRVSATLKMSGS
jgi:hypothetical protein